MEPFGKAGILKKRVGFSEKTGGMVLSFVAYQWGKPQISA
jgi:hypothetical protein